jgi:MSHA biogenesis protein MshJ
MTTQPPQPVGELAGGEPAAATAASANSAAGLYQHGLELRVEGRYLDVLGWLDALEKTPYRIYWRELDLQVGAEGRPVTRIAFFTLSREATWLRL